MKKTTTGVTPTNMVETLTLVELSAFCHVGPDWVEALVDHGVLEPISDDAEQWHFDPRSVARARKAQRLVCDFGLNAAGLALVLDLIDERDALLHKFAHLES